MEYFPGARSGAVNFPSASLFTLLEAPVDSFLTSNAASWIGFPDWSTTVPEIVPAVCAWSGREATPQSSSPRENTIAVVESRFMFCFNCAQVGKVSLLKVDSLKCRWGVEIGYQRKVTSA